MGVHSQVRIIGQSLPSANTNILVTDIKPIFDMSEFRIHFASSKAGRLSMKRTDILSGVTISELLGTANSGADEGTTYLIPVRNVTKYNFTFSVTNGTILVFQVDEISQ
jgi:hypothetical protein